MHFVIVITSHKTLQFAERCLASITWQIGKHDIDVVYRDDASGYTASELAQLKSLVMQAGGKLIAGKDRLYQIGSLDSIIRSVNTPQSIICELDGDDYLLPDAISTLQEIYTNQNVAMTYGGALVDFSPFRDYHYFGRDKQYTNTMFPENVWQERSFRCDEFRCFHFRTFRRWLWDLIDPEHFKRPEGLFFRGSGDSAFIYPMLEMLADPDHVHLIQEAVYVYRVHEGNVWRSDKQSQAKDFEYIRQMQPYDPLPREILRSYLANGQL